MPGFIVTFHPLPDGTPPQPASRYDRVGIAADGVERLETSDYVALVDGYVLGASSQQLVDALLGDDDSVLSGLHGNYCAVIVFRSGEIRGHVDRFGARSLFWEVCEDRRVVISSRWSAMPVSSGQWNGTGLGEMLRYRWMSGTETLLSGVSQLPQWHRLTVHPDGRISVRETAQQVALPTDSRAKSFGEKLDDTRDALNGAIGGVARTYRNAAILLSGGVDSALLAGLSRSHFDKCLLVSVEFPGEANPELEIAKAMARTLGLEQLIVPFDASRAEADLRALATAKGGQVNFLSLAMRQMVEAIPADYQLLIFGEAADILFGSDRYRHTEALLRLKRRTAFVPAFVSAAMRKAPVARMRKFAHLHEAGVRDIVLKNFQIQYPSASMKVIKALCQASLDGLYAHQAFERARAGAKDALEETNLRRLLQDIALRTTIANHLKETELSASAFGKHLFVPFMSRSVIEVAKTLTIEQYYGENYVKPVLRELACEFFDRDLIYREKHGFDVPHIQWLRGPLAGLVEAARRERELFDGSMLDRLDVGQHCSLFWSLINWQLVAEQVSGEGRSETRFAPGGRQLSAS